MSDHLIILDQLEDAAAALAVAGVPVEGMPDAAGRVRMVERRLAAIRHNWNEEQVEASRDPESPLGPPTMERTPYGSASTVATGEQYRTVVTRTAKRTYNTAPIIHGIAAAERLDPIGAIMFATQEGLARLEWRWTPLQKYAQRAGLPLRVVPGDIPDDGDIDGPWVGEQWTESIRQEARKEDQP